MKTLNDLIREVHDYVQSDAQGTPLYRGQANPNWTLAPRVARENLTWYDEARLYCNFEIQGRHLFPPSVSKGWDTCTLMQHHGLPSRLLDWTETFGVALHFAVREATDDAAIWILNPFKLNKLAMSLELFRVLDDYPPGYFDYFLRRESQDFGKFPGPIVAAYHVGLVSRLRAQRGVFTVHADLTKPLEILFPEAVRRFVVPANLIPEAKHFLRLFGIGDFALLQDLDSLCRQLYREQVADHRR